MGVAAVVGDYMGAEAVADGDEPGEGNDVSLRREGLRGSFVADDRLAPDGASVVRDARDG